jgi:hypothetical protein
LVDSALASGNPRQHPLGGGHLFEMEPFSAVLGLPIG